MMSLNYLPLQSFTLIRTVRIVISTVRVCVSSVWGEITKLTTKIERNKGINKVNVRYVHSVSDGISV